MKDSTMVKASFYMAIAALVLCVVFGAVTVFAWLNITPEMVGETVYAWLYVALPFLMFAWGFGFGFSVRHIAASRAARKAAGDPQGDGGADLERLASRFEHMDYFDKLFVAFAYGYGGRSGGVSSMIYGELHDQSLLDYTVVGDGVRKYRATEEARELFEARPELLGFYEPEGDECDWLARELMRIAERRDIGF